MQYLLLLVLGAALWAKGFIAPCAMPLAGPESPFYQLLYLHLPSQHLLMVVAGFIVVVFEGLLLNQILIRHDLLPKNNLLGAFIFILLMSQSAQALTLNPQLLAALFMIPAIDRIMNSYGQADPTRDVFSAAFLIGLASLFQFSALFMLVILLLSFVVFGTFSLRMLLVAASGIFTVYLYLFLYYFLVDELGGQYCLYLDWFRHLPVASYDFHIARYFLWSMQGLMLIAALLFVSAHINEWNISKRKTVLLIIWFMIVAGGSMVFLRNNLFIGAMVTAIPVAMLLSVYLSGRRKVPLLLEMYLLIWFLAAFVNNMFISPC